MKKTRLLFFTLLLLVVSIGVQAQDFNYTANDRVWKCGLDTDGTAIIMGVTEPVTTCSGTLNIPDEVIDYEGVHHSVTKISTQAFLAYKLITEVNIPASVKTIQESAFAYCKGLVNIGMPGVETIGENAFSGCTGITSLTIPSSVKTIGKYAFSDCTALTGDFTIPATVKEIQEGAFSNCHFNGTLTVLAQQQPTGSIYGQGIFKATNIFSGSNFAHIVLGGPHPTSFATRTDGFEAPVWFGNGIQDISFRSDVQRIAANAFSGVDLSHVNSFAIPANVKEIGFYAFSNSKLQGAITIPNTVTTVESGAFYNNNGITSLAIEATAITEVPDYICANCPNLTEVHLPAGITKLERNCFSGCAALADLILPTGVTEIGFEALRGTALVHLVLPEGVTTIGQNAFADCTSLTSITPFPSTLTTIGNSAFQNCTKLQGDANGFLPASLKRLGASAFANDKGITGEAVFPQFEPVAADDDMVTVGNPFLNTSVYGIRMGEWDKYFAPNQYNNIRSEWQSYSGLLYVDARNCTVRLANQKGEPNLAYKFTRYVHNSRQDEYRNFSNISVNTLIYLPSEEKFNNPALPAETFDQRFETDPYDDEYGDAANFIMDGKCKQFLVKDGLPYRVPIAFTALEAKYNRTFNVTDGKAVSTLYLPYPTDLPDGMQAYTLVKKGFDEHGDKAFIFREVPTGTRLEANKPYLVRITDGQTHKLPVMHDVEVPVSPKMTGADSGQIGIEDTDWKFYGTTEKISNADAYAKKAYYLNGNKWWAVQDGEENDYIAPFRCFVSSPTGAAPAKSFALVLGNGSETTDINALESSMEGDIRSGKYPFYSVDGKMMGRDYDKLVRGQIYVVNGKKFYKF